MLRATSLFVLLFALWLLLSGRGEALYALLVLLSGRGELLLLALGAVSSAVVVAIAWRMDLIDNEGHPVQLSWRILFYWPWLFWEIAKANVAVARIILHPTLPIAPVMLKARTSQRSELGQVIYANSITLTPGTISVDVEESAIHVHCLDRDLAASIESGEMDRRVAKVEGAG